MVQTWLLKTTNRMGPCRLHETTATPAVPKSNFQIFISVHVLQVLKLWKLKQRKRMVCSDFELRVWMMNGALAGRHLMQETGPVLLPLSSSNIPHHSLPLSFTCDLLPFLPQCSPPPPSSTTTTP
ncbi:hypothetical protein VNO80_10869 [Phaseolus coccineus]|uniref:Uncharacterized protein n=1 Tax=Phaseolus coccineus TaxID=3886 RepID=A0AAN9RJV2_PHACN